MTGIRQLLCVIRARARFGAGSSLGRDRQAEPARLRDLKRSASPRGVVRLCVESDPRVLGVGGELIDVLGRADVDPHAHTLVATATLLPVVLTKANLDVARP